MASFRYRALTSAGKIVTGQLDASSAAAALGQVRSLGHYPISARSPGLGLLQTVSRSVIDRPRVAGRALALITQELATLLEAGIELDTAIEMLLRMAETKALAAPLNRVRARIRDGNSLGDALEAEPVFPKSYVSMVRASEWSGTLAATLSQLADYLARAQATRDAIASALVYPIILLATAGLSVIFLLLFVLPSFETVLSNAGAKLPLATRVVFGLSDLLLSAWWALLLALVAAFVIGKRALRKPSLRRRRDLLLLRMPVIGELLLKIDTERFCRTLGTLLRGGVDLPKALVLSRDTLANGVLGQAIEETALSLKEGDSLAARLARTDAFAAMTIDLLRVGESTGQLDRMLLHHADLLERNARHITDRLLAMLVPALTILLGVIVGGLIASMLVAILSVNELAL